MQTKSKTVTLRLTENEYELLHKNAANLELNISEFLRYLVQIPVEKHAATCKTDILVIDCKTLASISKELVKWGRHYNQGIRALNTICLIMRKNSPNYETLEEEILKSQKYLEETEAGRKEIESVASKLTSYTLVRR